VAALVVGQQTARVEPMGATGWSYFVPYEADVSAALQRLREDVFNRGDYLCDDVTDDQPEANPQKVLRVAEPWVQRLREDAAKLQEPSRTLYLQAAENVKAEILGGGTAPRKPKGKPKTIEEALEIQADSGTHSILDIVGVSSEPAFGHVRPFPPEKLLEFFGSHTPSRAKIEEAYDFGSLEDFLSERWEGIYVIAYCDGLPSEIFFAGCSGD
jgi:hypothetical protein